MTHVHPLYGACNCGRNRYIVEIPPSSPSLAQVIFDDRSFSGISPHSHTPLPLTDLTLGRHAAAQLTPYLRVPLAWYHSSTYALYPDETHTSIRRTYTPHLASRDRHQFCGYCGSQLTRWSEDSREEADFIRLALSTLLDVDLDDLEDRGVIVFDDDDARQETGTQMKLLQGPEQQPSGISQQQGQVSLARRELPTRSEIYFDPRLGRIKRQMGGHTSNDGTMRVEWEVMEWSNGDDEMMDRTLSGQATPVGKRKAGQLEADDVRGGVMQ